MTHGLFKHHTQKFRSNSQQLKKVVGQVGQVGQVIIYVDNMYINKGFSEEMKNCGNLKPWVKMPFSWVRMAIWWVRPRSSLPYRDMYMKGVYKWLSSNWLIWCCNTRPRERASMCTYPKTESRHPLRHSLGVRCKHRQVFA